MGARAPLLSRRIQFHSCKFVPFFLHVRDVSMCVCGLYITDRVVASRLGRGPPDPHTLTHRNMKKKMKKNKFLFLFCQFFSSFWFTFYDGDYDFLSARIIVRFCCCCCCRGGGYLLLFSRTGFNPDENELFGGRNKQQCQREPSTYVYVVA